MPLALKITFFPIYLRLQAVAKKNLNPRNIDLVKKELLGTNSVSFID